MTTNYKKTAQVKAILKANGIIAKVKGDGTNRFFHIENKETRNDIFKTQLEGCGFIVLTDRGEYFAVKTF